MAAAVLNDIDTVTRVEKLIESLARAGKEMYSVCFSQADKRTKASALPLLQRIDDFEICAALLIMFIRNDEKTLQQLVEKLQTYADEMQENLTDLKAKISVNKDFLSQIKGEYQTFNHTFDEITERITRIDKRIKTENTTNRNETAHKINMDMVEAEIKLMETERAKSKAVDYLRVKNGERKATEVKLIDAFEEITMETESRQLILAEQAKKKAEALCLKAERKHTDTEMWYLKLKNKHRAMMEGYDTDIRKRYQIKVESNLNKQKSPVGSKVSTPKQHRKHDQSPKNERASDSSPEYDPNKSQTPPHSRTSSFTSIDEDVSTTQ
ncbi:uncharacterized protein [Amphiura filiformis]|uniref:uncharacterized protein n=1 Tax=Amphiura filiformis TaxID=82378 RepID=UPI003B21BBB7